MATVIPRQLVSVVLAGALLACAGAPPARPAAAAVHAVAAPAAPASAAPGPVQPPPPMPPLPADVPSRVALAERLLADGVEPDRVAALIEGIPANHPKRELLVGLLAERRGDVVGAVNAYGRLLAASDDPEIRLRRALLFERLGRPLDATAELEQVRAVEPANATVRGRLAERYEATGRLDEAEAELRALAEAQAGRPEGWRRLAAFCARNGRSDRPSCAQARARESGAPARRELRELRPLLPAGR